MEFCFFSVSGTTLPKFFTSICRLDATSFASLHIASQLSRRATSCASKLSMFANFMSEATSLVRMTLLQVNGHQHSVIHDWHHDAVERTDITNRPTDFFPVFLE